MSDELRRAFYANSVNSLDFDSYIPDLHGITEILTEEHRKQLSRHLPARAEGNFFYILHSRNYAYSMMHSLITRASIIQYLENVVGPIKKCIVNKVDFTSN